VNADHEPWVRSTERLLWDLRSTVSFLVALPDRSEMLGWLFRRYRHAWKDSSRYALDHLDYLIAAQDLSDEMTVQEAIAKLKEMRRAGYR
jgi:hypothetical protein